MISISNAAMNMPLAKRMLSYRTVTVIECLLSGMLPSQSSSIEQSIAKNKEAVISDHQSFIQRVAQGAVRTTTTTTTAPPVMFILGSQQAVRVRYLCQVEAVIKVDQQDRPQFGKR